MTNYVPHSALPQLERAIYDRDTRVNLSSTWLHVSVSFRNECWFCAANDRFKFASIKRQRALLVRRKSLARKTFAPQTDRVNSFDRIKSGHR